ncbi:MAG: thioredoxin family protein [Pseudomonadota bacterium]
MAATTPICDFGRDAVPFELPATDGRTLTLEDVAGERGTLVMFICNHCPYVIGVLDRLKSEASALQAMGIGVAAICSNDATTHPADSFPRMKEMAEREWFPFPYLHDEDQSVARAYDAVCTPDFFGFNSELKLQYRGRLDAKGRAGAPSDEERELYHAMKLIAETGEGPQDQVPSMGCSIKWRAA